MMPSHRARLSLRARLILWQVAVLAPLLLAILLHHLYLVPRFTGPLAEVSEEIAGEVLQVKSLQLSLHMATMPVHDYLIAGNPGDIEAFASRSRRIEQGFSAARSAPFGSEHEKRLIEEAWHEWRRARDTARGLLDAAPSATDPAIEARMERFDRHIGIASDKLEALYNEAYAEIRNAQARARVARHRSQWLGPAALGAAFLLSVMIGTILSHSILVGLRSLRHGAGQVAAGRFDGEIRAGGVEELDDLARDFNAMRTKMREHDAALRELATRDTLTGLRNRRALRAVLDDELERARRYGRPLGLLMIDIDHFKQVNDTWGHPVGDAVLAGLASVLEQNTRPTDGVFRYGGEEFVIVAPETGPEGLRGLGERIRRAAGAKVFGASRDEDLQVTISVGAAACEAGMRDTPELIAAADEALYSAKRNGRDSVRLYRPRSVPSGACGNDHS